MSTKSTDVLLPTNVAPIWVVRMKRLKEVNVILRNVNGLSASFRKNPSEENEVSLKAQLTDLKNLLNEVIID